MKVILYSADLSSELPLPFADSGVRAGFPSPAQDYLTESIDLNRDIIKHQATTFYARCVGTSMLGAGIDDGDLLVVDKSLEAKDGDIVIAFIDGDFTVKRIKLDPSDKCLWLMPENDAFEPIKVDDSSDFEVWGVVTYNIKKMK
ncbi:MAG: translesion error-prone DNA polymerase V autoproteolytic subunit [Prevotellaceae bacterium]|nr:translesion error-prone DNA polymerase V autoproteolytic subunit [Candidatus Minthosoma caballi]